MGKGNETMEWGMLSFKLPVILSDSEESSTSDTNANAFTLTWSAEDTSLVPR